LIEKKDPVILVTSAFHMRRAKALFQGRGIKIIPAPAGHLVDAGRGDRHIGNQLPGSKYLGFAELALWEHLGLIWFSVTSNHIHLLVYGNEDREVIPRSLQLIAGRTAQAYNRRKNRNGAFWEDRYHATAVDTDEHLIPWWSCTRTGLTISSRKKRPGRRHGQKHWLLAVFSSLRR
jgi:hypothetical protein